MRRFIVVLIIMSALVPLRASAKPSLRLAGPASAESVVITDYDYALPAPDRYAVSFSFREVDAAKLARLMRASLGSHLVLTIGSLETLLPTVRGGTGGRRLELTLGDPKTYAAVAAELAR